MALFDIIGSTLLAAAVIVAILAMNVFLYDSSAEIGADVNAQENMTQFTKSIQWDFSKIGNRDPSRNSVLVAKADTFMFRGDLDNNGSLDTVKYFKGPVSRLSSTPNPRDFILYRVTYRPLDTLKIYAGLTMFALTYYDSTGASTLIPQKVRGFKVTARMESPFSNSDSASTGVAWEDMIFPRNLNLTK